MIESAIIGFIVGIVVGMCLGVYSMDESVKSEDEITKLIDKAHKEGYRVKSIKYRER